MSAGKTLQSRYLVERQIGAGGMGTVYVATDQRFGSTVAIKETLFADPGLRRAFEREAQLLNSLRHPALPRVSDHFTEGNGAFIVMEYIPGEDLSVMLERDGAFAVADVLRWADQLLDALDYLHNQKSSVIHRDIKPQNLKLTARGEIILLDFGLAKGSTLEISQVSMTKSIFGYSRSYAPLEQIQGTGTDPRSDLYGLAATVFHLLTGKPPIDALTRATAVLNGCSDPLQHAHLINPKVPAAVSNLFYQTMALNAGVRPATAAQMRFALTEAINNPTATAEVFDGSTVLSTSAAVFTQNTQLLNAETTGTDNAPANGATNILGEPNTVVASKNSNTLQNEQTSSGSSSSIVAQNLLVSRRSVFAPISWAAAAAVVLLLVGGGTAAWYATGMTGISSNPADNQKLNIAPQNETTTVTTETVAPTSPLNANSAIVQPNPVTPPDKPLPPSATHPKSPELATGNSSKDKNQRSQRGRSATEETENSVDLENVDKEIDEAMGEAMDEAKNKGRGFDDVPAELRSNDPRNPVDPTKLKIFIKKQRDAALRQVREANRLRLGQGLPPLPPAVKSRNKRRSQTQNDDPDLAN